VSTLEKSKVTLKNKEAARDTKGASLEKANSLQLSER
jgi:hypothetical protein